MLPVRRADLPNMDVAPTPKALVRLAVREEFVPREKSATVLIFSAYV